jgi:fermentation-respiration switch protein FrsA (DUF1100 family)
MAPGKRRVILRILVALFAIEVLLPVVMVLARHRLMFFPFRDPPARAGLGLAGEGVEILLVEVKRPGGRGLEAYDARPSGAPDTGPVVLFLHGNAGNIAGRARLLGGFVRGTGCRTLLLDYSGFGGNAGSPSEDEVVADGLAAFDHLRAAGIPAGRIVLYGESIGGAVAAAVAAQRECGGVVLQSTFSSTSSMAFRAYPFVPLASLLVRGSFPTAQRVRTIRAPILVVHGDLDAIVPLAEGKLVHAACPPGTELLLVEAADHNDLMEIGGRAYLQGLGERFRKWTAGR